MPIELGIPYHPDLDASKKTPEKSIGKFISRAIFTGSIVWGGTIGMIGASHLPSSDSSDKLTFDTLHTALIDVTPTTICYETDPDKGQPSSFVGMSRLFFKDGNPQGTITWVKADMALTRLQGTSSSPDDPKDGSVFIMEKGFGRGNFIQVGIINRGNGSLVFSAWAHNLGLADGTYCERYFGKATGKKSAFRIDHDETKGLFYLKKNDVVIQKISETELGWSEVFRAEIFSETHGPAGYAKMPVSWVKNIQINNEEALYGSSGGGPIGADAAEHTIYYSKSDPNKPTGFSVRSY